MKNFRVQLLVLLVLGVYPHIFASDTSKPRFKVIELIKSNPFFGPSVSRIFYAAPYVVYQREYSFCAFVASANPDDEIGTDTIIPVQTSEEIRKQFFVFHRDSSFGVNYLEKDSFRNNQRSPVDSILLQMTGSNDFEKLVINMKADSSSWNADRTELTELYLAEGRKDTPDVKISFSYSSKLNHLQLFLNSKLDSIKNMKFYKFEYLVEPFYDQKRDLHTPQLILMNEIKEIETDDVSELLQYIEKYKKEMGGT